MLRAGGWLAGGVVGGLADGGEGRCGRRVDEDTRRMGIRWIVGLD